MEEDKQLKEQIDEWMECWTKKKFPHGKEYEEYSEWKKFFNFWTKVYPELPLKVAHQIYLIKLKEENVK